MRYVHFFIFRRESCFIRAVAFPPHADTKVHHKTVCMYKFLTSPQNRIFYPVIRSRSRSPTQPHNKEQPVTYRHSQLYEHTRYYCICLTTYIHAEPHIHAYPVPVSLSSMKVYILSHIQPHTWKPAPKLYVGTLGHIQVSLADVVAFLKESCPWTPLL